MMYDEKCHARGLLNSNIFLDSSTNDWKVWICPWKCIKMIQNFGKILCGLSAHASWWSIINYRGNYKIKCTLLNGHINHEIWCPRTTFIQREHTNLELLFCKPSLCHFSYLNRFAKLCVFFYFFNGGLEHFVSCTSMYWKVSVFDWKCLGLVAPERI